MERLVRRFPVLTERGDELTLFEFQDFREWRTARGPRKVAGRKRFMLDTGEPVDQADDEHFVLASTGEVLSKNDPES